MTRVHEDISHPKKEHYRDWFSRDLLVATSCDFVLGIFGSNFENPDMIPKNWTLIFCPDVTISNILDEGSLPI